MSNAQDPVEIFRLEARDLLEEVEQGLLDLIAQPGERALIDAVFRGLHTLKGSGAMFGFDALAAFTHHCETAFDKVRKGEVQATPALISAVLAARDYMRVLVEDSAAANPAAGEDLLAELHRAVAQAAGAEAAAEEAPAAKGWRVTFALPADSMAHGTNPLGLLAEMRDLGDCRIVASTENVPPLEALDPQEIHLSWTVELFGDISREAIEDVFIFVMDDMRLEIEEIAAPAPQAETPKAEAPKKAKAEPKVEAAAPAPAAKAPAKTAKAANDESAPSERRNTGGESVRVAAERLDELLDRVGELVIAQSRLKQLAQSSADNALRSVAEDIERLASEMRDTMMVVRMVPISNLFGRFRRLIHDLAAETGKTIELSTRGETTELDKTIIERLADPLIHLIRNAADHGLEKPEDRKAAGKPAAGQLLLAARHAGAEVIITLTDDGRGIDRDRVRARAEENGLIAPGAQLTDSEVYQLIFQPGFSTAKEVTNLSGRGVGMDVVKRTIEALRGSIDIQSTPGHGSEISLRIPLTLAIIDGLLVRVGEGRYVIPLAAVEECVELSREQDMRSTGRSFIPLRDQLVPFLRLREIFTVDAPIGLHQKVVVVSTGEDRVGLVVDQILGDHQTVIKSLSSLHADVETFSGATILGDGGVALILDVPHLVAAGQQLEKRLSAAG